LNERQRQLEAWGVKVTTSFAEAVADCDAIMIEINDPSFHWEYFQKCSGLAKPIFLDKPLADSMAVGQQIHRLAKEKGCPLFSCSSLRFSPQLIQACQRAPQPLFASVYGALGQAPAGSSIVWYGVHALEMLNRAMGRGAESVLVKKGGAGCVAIVQYPDQRRGVVELTSALWEYGGVLRQKEVTAFYTVDMGTVYSDLLRQIVAFFRDPQTPPVAMEDTLEVMALLDATQRAYDSGREESL